MTAETRTREAGTAGSSPGPRRPAALASRLAGVALLALTTGAAADADHEDVRSREPVELDAAFALVSRSAEPTWLAYAVPGQPRHEASGHWGHCRCELELDGGDARHVHLSDDGEPLLMLLRFAGGELERVRVVGADCRVTHRRDGAVWAGEVEPAESLALLRPLLTAAPHEIADDLLPGIAHHRGPEATRLLTELASTGGHGELAEDAVFWLGTARGQAGYESLVRLLESRPEIDLRKAVVFALHQSPVDAAAARLARLAVSDPDPEIRREALFWLGQSGLAHAEMIYDAALGDADDDVARHAVFVLGQRPEPENIEYLARVLRQDRRPELRKEALFWIGQVDSSDALDIVSRVLNE